MGRVYKCQTCGEWREDTCPACDVEPGEDPRVPWDLTYEDKRLLARHVLLLKYRRPKRS